MSTTVRTRAEQPVEHTWDVHSVFPDDAAWEAALSELDAVLPQLEGFRGRLGESARVLLEGLRCSDRVVVDANRVMLYAHMHYDVDSADPVAAARFERAISLMTRLAAAGAGRVSEIAAIGWETLEAWMAQEPDLRLYAQYFDVLLRQREHFRSAEVEEALALAQEPLLGAWIAGNALTDTDLCFGAAVGADGRTYQVAQGTISSLLEHCDREVRRSAWERYADGYLSVRHTLAALVGASVKRGVFWARVRRYQSARQAAMSFNFIPAEVYDHVLRAYQDHLPVWHRYWRLKRRALGVDRLHVFDLAAPLAQSPPEVSYEQAVEWLIEAMAPLGPDYTEPLRRGLRKERWVDVFPNQGKRGGAYSGGVYGTHPFALMNWTGGLWQLSILAHELGHSMHSYFFNQAQPPAYADVSIFLAEIASNFNQAMVRAYLLEQHPEPQFRIAVLGEALANFHRYLFVMPLLARFEDECYRRVERGEGVTEADMADRMLDLFREGYGGEVEIDEARVGITWAQFVHLHLNFYVYQYATGIAAAHALAAPVLRGEAGAAARYLEFLRTGSSRYPLDALQAAGADMTSPEPLQRAYQVLDEYVSQLEACYPSS
jgi:oligoendopeptidase F